LLVKGERRLAKFVARIQFARLTEKLLKMKLHLKHPSC